jgi:hypothetical protein
MTNTRYVLTPDPGTILDDYIQAAIAAITAISGRPLESLDAIPEHLRHLFREQTVMTVQAAGAVKTGQAVYACPICSMPMTDTDGGCVRHDPEEIAAWDRPDTPPAGSLPWRDHIKHCVIDDDAKPAAPAYDQETVPADLAAAIKAYHDGPMSDDHARTLMGYVRQYGAERDALKSDLSAQSNLANAAGKTIDQLKSEIEELKNFCEKGVASNDRLLLVIDQRDAFKAEVEQRIRERDHYAEQNNLWMADVKTLKAEIAALRLKCGEF